METHKISKKKNRRKCGEGKGRKRKRTKSFTNLKGQSNLKIKMNFFKGDEKSRERN